MHVVKSLLDGSHTVYGIDNLNDYYDVSLKEARLAVLKKLEGFKFEKIDLTNFDKLLEIFNSLKPDVVINLAAQAGVRYSIENPWTYIDSNVMGFLNVLESCKRSSVKHLVYASSSSVYGNDSHIPFKEEESVEKPISIYASTKKMNELMAHTYTHQTGLKTTGLRLFTVYGPWGRPDMAPYLFTKAIVNKEPITVFNNGNLLRDFTYIDDVAKAISNISTAGDWRDMPIYNVFNVGNSSPTKLMDFISILEKELGMTANKIFSDMQSGDVFETYADSSKLFKVNGFKPETSLKEGVGHFVNWYKAYHLNEGKLF